MCFLFVIVFVVVFGVFVLFGLLFFGGWGGHIIRGENL